MSKQARRPRLLLLAGTAEARALAERLAERKEIEAIVSLAGATREPARYPGQVRSGGFGGAEGLACYLKRARIDLLVDATHPYAGTMSDNATTAAAQAMVPRLLFARPAWKAQTGDNWIEVDNAEAATGALRNLGKRVFLAIGRKELAPFAALAERRFLLRLVEPPSAPPPFARYALIVARGPFEERRERALLEANAIDAVVAKNSGGQSSYAKIAAARALKIPVVMLARPPAPQGDTAETLEEALAWIDAQRSQENRR